MPKLMEIIINTKAAGYLCWLFFQSHFQTAKGAILFFYSSIVFFCFLNTIFAPQAVSFFVGLCTCVCTAQSLHKHGQKAREAAAAGVKQQQNSRVPPETPRHLFQDTPEKIQARTCFV